MLDSDPLKSDVSEIDRLQQMAAQIMSNLEDAHEAAMRVQASGAEHRDLIDGFDTITGELIAIEKLIVYAEIVTS